MTNSISFTLVYDKPALPNFLSGWGLSLWIEFGERIVLFDSGWNGELLLSNLKACNKNINDITDIFLSHNHWDHVGGIVYLLNKKLESLENIFVPKSFSFHFKEELKAMGNVREISQTQTHPGHGACQPAGRR